MDFRPNFVPLLLFEFLIPSCQGDSNGTINHVLSCSFLQIVVPTNDANCGRVDSKGDVGCLGKVVVSISVWAVSCLEQWFKVQRDLLQENTSSNSSRLILLFIKIQLLPIEYKQPGLYT